MDIVYFAQVDYQERVETEAPVEHPGRLEVRPFPSYPPVAYGENYGGYKVFPFEGWLCVSRYANRGRTDRDGRPLLTADVALLDRDEYESVGRDVGLVVEFLRDERERTPGAFDRYVESAPSVAERATLRETCREFDRRLLANFSSHLLESGTARIYHADRGRAQAFVRIAWSLLPWSFVSETSLASDCRSPDREDTEDVVLVAGRPDEEGEGRLFGRSRQRPVDLSAGSTPAGPDADLFETVLAELLEGEPWYDHEWEEQRRTLLEHVAGTVEGDGRSLYDRSQPLAEMRRTVERAREIDTVGDDGGLL